jgi:hypothetical protein
MHGPFLATLLVVLTLGSAQASPPSTADAIAEARGKLAADDGIAAVALLEAALPAAGSGKDKDAVLELLRQAYESAAKQAQTAGRVADAETYRENLKILTRKSRSAKAAPVLATPSKPVAEVPSPPPSRSESVAPSTEPLVGGPTLLPEGPAAVPGVDTSSPPAVPASPRSEESKVVAPPSSQPDAGPSAPSAMPADAAPSELAAADAAFVAEDYPEAGRIYAKLAQEKRLPAERRDQWFYCRAFVVVARINAHPKNESEWASINAEIERVRALNPKNYLGEYLRNLASERQGASKKSKVAKAMVVRGSAPEESARVDRPVQPASNVASPETPSTPAPPISTSNPGTSKSGTAIGQWQMLTTANFRIYHVDPALAAKVAQAAEVARRDQLKRWSKQPARANWQPLCELYLYPTAKHYATMTGQPEDSPGFSTMGMNAGRINSRRINLRADHAALVQAVLPHEITHVILADHFTERQIPRWADEGMAVLSEPDDEQQRRAADLVKPLADNRLFAVDVLMNMDYPDERYWNLYYAQSVSLTRFLVENGGPAQMIQFLQESQRDGYEPALRKVYKIEGFTDLQRRWVAYARSTAQTQGVAANKPDVRAR